VSGPLVEDHTLVDKGAIRHVAVFRSKSLITLYEGTPSSWDRRRVRHIPSAVRKCRGATTLE